MLVRTNSILLFWSAFPAQPIKVVDHVPPPSANTSIHSTNETAEVISPDSTAHSANTSTCNSSEYGVVTSITSTTLEVPTILMRQVEGENTHPLPLPPPPPAPPSSPPPPEDEEEDAIDSLSACSDQNNAQESIKEPSIISNIADQTTSLLDNPIPTYYTHTTEDDTDNIIYYKRREDYYPSLFPPPPPTLPPPAPTKEPRLNHLLETKIHSITLDDSEGMPVFKPATTDKTKPRAMLRRLKTMVKRKNKLYLL
ncbi:hypothetical protein INT47_001150 [Mucor saturninus]|uniref:Uncharacterized protein n=1 Tax=Mucor saturninus TaxID=64648 RepID=A0A8H7RMK9_9FUNG|nr:hypothetical protein INT47_001150 [Mucor saturninus]